MEQVGKMWSNLRSKCQTLFHGDGCSGPGGDAIDAIDAVHCVLDLGGGSAEAPPTSSPSATSSPSRSMLPLPLVAAAAAAAAGGRRRHHHHHNCVSDIPQIVEITVDGKDNAEDLRGGGGGGGPPGGGGGGVPLARRDSYSRHAPWGGKKKHSCSTKTQSSLEADNSSSRRSAAGGRSSRGASRRDRRYGVSSIQDVSSTGGGGGGGDSGASRSLSARSLRQRLSDTVGLCLPLPNPRRRSRSSKIPGGGGGGGGASKRKIHLTELMLETCPFPPGSDLAHKWHLIKQHTAPVSPHSSTALLDAFDPAAHPSSSTTSSSSSSPEDEEERLRERRRLSIEEGVDPPPNAQIHTLEAPSVPGGSSLYKLGPKMAPGGLGGDGGGEGAGCSSGSSSGASAGGGGLGQALGAGAVAAAFSSSSSAQQQDCDSEEDSTTLCLQARRPKQRHASGGDRVQQQQAAAAGPWKVHTQIDYIHCLVPDLLRVTALPCYWGVMDRYEAEALLDGRPEGTFLLRDSAQEDYLFSVSFRRYNRSLHARIEQWNHNFSFDAHDPCVFHASTVTALLEHYKDPGACMFFEPLLTAPLHRTFPFGLQRLARAAICRRTTYDGIGALPLPPALHGFLKEYHYKQKVRVRWLEREPPAFNKVK